MISVRLCSDGFKPVKQFSRYIRFFKSKTETVPPPRPLASDPALDVTEVVKVENQLKSIAKRQLPFSHPLITNRQAWVENLDTLEPNYQGIIDLHASVFGERVRIDVIHANFQWQSVYRRVQRESVRWQHEIKRSNKKPWPLKCGRARHGTRRSNIFKGGVKLFGPHGPSTHYYMLPKHFRVLGICCMLSVKYAQNDLHIVNNLEIPTSNPSYLEELAESRKWGPSVLFVDVNDIMPKNISLACHELGHFNLLPAYGLNVLCMLKHDTLILTLDAVDRIEQRLLFHLNSSKVWYKRHHCRPEIKGLDSYDHYQKTVNRLPFRKLR